jgi:uncharacterized protein with von Willebrand factor type A (vWA) domain
MDTSGSMQGARSVWALALLKSFYKYARNVLNYPKLRLISFNTKITRGSIPLGPEEYNYAYNAGGGTYFTGAVNEIKALVEQESSMLKEKRLSIVFLTDGEIQDTRDTEKNYANLNKAFDDLKVALEQNTDQYEFHTIGVSKEHDPVLLDRVTQMSNVQGTYHYLLSTEEVDGICEGIQAMIAESQISCVLRSSKQPQFIKKLCMQPLVQPNKGYQLSFEALYLLSADDLATNQDAIWEASVFKGKTTLGNVKVQGKDFANTDTTTTTGGPSLFDVLRMKLNVLKEQIAGIVNQLTAAAKNGTSTERMKEIEIIAEKFALIRHQFQSVAAKMFRFPPTQREILTKSAGWLRDYIDSATTLLNGAFTGTVSNDLIANVNSLAFKEITDKRIKKQLERRAQTAAKAINEAYKEVEDISKEINEAELTTKYEKLSEEVGACAYSVQSFPEAIKAGDCLCITFDIGRSELTIVAPSTAVIKEIYPTIMSAQSFLDSIKFRLKNNPMAHGGFDPSAQGKILGGVARENITGALPIFICDEHWKIARHLIKPVIGWVITLDPLGYNYDQLRVLPFLLMMNAALGMLDPKSPRKAFFAKTFNFLKETCIHLMIDDLAAAGTWQEEFRTWFDSYLTPKKCEIRTPDTIAHNGIFLMQVYCAIELGWIQAPKEHYFWNLFFEAMIDEEIRRKLTPQGVTPKEITSGRVYQLLGIDYTNDLKPIVDETATRLAEEAKAAEEKKKEEDTKMKELGTKPPVAEEVKKDDAAPGDPVEKPEDDKNPIKVNIHNLVKPTLTAEAVEEIKKYSAMYTSECVYIMALKRLFVPGEEKKELETTLESIGLQKDIIVLAHLLQNQTQVKNSDRRKMLKYEKYFEVRQKPLEYIEFLVRDVLYQDAKALLKVKNTAFILPDSMGWIQRKKRVTEGQKQKLAMLYALLKLDKPDEIAEMFRTLGKKSRQFYLKWFLRYGGSALEVKIKLLIEGVHDGKVVMPGWQDHYYPKIKYVAKMVKRYPVDMVEMKKLFAELK